MSILYRASCKISTKLGVTSRDLRSRPTASRRRRRLDAQRE
jgi:hypothetical protein